MVSSTFSDKGAGKLVLVKSSAPISMPATLIRVEILSGTAERNGIVVSVTTMGWGSALVEL